jgi:hypothetical protein
MAGNLAELNNYLNNVLQITQLPVREALNDQGLDAFDALSTLEEEDIKRICDTIRKPGGIIINPNAAIAGQPPTIPNPGVAIGQVHEKRLKMLRYFVFHMTRIQRMPFPVAIANLANLGAIYLLKDNDDGDDKPTPPEALKKIENVRVVIEDLDAYLLKMRGRSGCPLMYVCRDTVALPAVDPGFGLPTYHEEMVLRAPHVGQYYQDDNIQVWNIVRNICHDGPGWNWISAFARSQNGRAAYVALKTHYLGDSYRARIRSMADAKLDTAYYDGKARNFTFEMYCAALNTAFTDLETTGELVSDERKMRVFLKGLIDPKLEAAKAQVMGNDGLKNNFDSAVNWIAEWNDNMRSVRAGQATNRSVAAANSGGRGGAAGRGGGRGNDPGRGGRSGRGGGRGGGRGRGGRGRGANNSQPTDRYYSPEEWTALSYEEKQAVRDKRIQRDQRRGVQVVQQQQYANEDRSVRQRTDTEQIGETNSASNNNRSVSMVGTVARGAGIGPVMSRRYPNGQQPGDGGPVT